MSAPLPSSTLVQADELVVPLILPGKDPSA
jgi:hypothetical protein